jgi:hypothetical protein
MAPKEPDWAFLGTIDPEDLDEEKADKVGGETKNIGRRWVFIESPTKKLVSVDKYIKRDEFIEKQIEAEEGI